LTRKLTSLLAACLVVLPGSALAANFDVSLTGFIDQNGKQDTAGFRAVSEAIALAMQPRWSGPASTLGSRGFDVGFNWMHTGIDGGDEHWKIAVPDRTLRGLQTSQVHFRKGLPYSFELGGTVSALNDSRLYGVGFELKWAFVESYKYAPDFGVRNHVSTTLGSRDLSLLNAGIDTVMSKSFGILGVVQATPFMGYNFSYTQARSHVLGVFEPGEVELDTDIIDAKHIFSHRIVLGLALHASWAELGFEAALPAKDEGDTVPTYTTRLGLQF
jgi:hypothetical protein